MASANPNPNQQAKPSLVLFTGLSGAGKSTLAQAVVTGVEQVVGGRWPT